MNQGLDDVSGAISAHEATSKRMADEVEKIEDHLNKDGNEAIDPAEEKRLIRKLDLWYGVFGSR
jgi:hypothetical protein